MTQRDPAVACDNCDWSGVESDLDATLESVPHLCERLDPGSEVPAGECPECGALAYLVDGQRVKSAAAILLVTACAGAERGGTMPWKDLAPALDAAKQELGPVMVARIEAQARTATRG